MTSEPNYAAPSNQCLQHAVKITNTMEDRPIMMDYWTNSHDKNVLVGAACKGRW